MPLERRSSVRKPSPAEAVRLAISAALANVNVGIPAVVTRYDADKRIVDCQPLVLNSYLDEEDERQVEKLPVVPNCGLQIDGSGKTRTTYPISDGTLQIDGETMPATLGWLKFSQRSIAKYLSGDGSNPVDPEIDHEHDLSDGVFIPGLRPIGNPWGDVPTDHATFGHDEGVQLHSHKNVMTVAKKADESSAVAVTLDGDSAGFLVWTPNVPPGGAASLVYSTTDPGVIVAPSVKFSLVVAASAEQLKAK